MTADEMQVQLMRRTPPRARAAMALRLSDETIGLARRAIARAFPALDARGRDLKFVELHYGVELARKLEVWLSAHPAG